MKYIQIILIFMFCILLYVKIRKAIKTRIYNRNVAKRKLQIEELLKSGKELTTGEKLFTLSGGHYSTVMDEIRHRQRFRWYYSAKFTITIHFLTFIDNVKAQFS